MRLVNRFIACGLIVALLGISGCFFGRGSGGYGHHGGEGEGEHHMIGR
jgi:hypothetical protein